MTWKVSPTILCLFLAFLRTSDAVKCNSMTFKEIDNEMSFTSSDVVDCPNYCYSSYSNDGWYTVYTLGCDTSNTMCTASGCTDQPTTSTKVCCCNSADLCIDPKASDPVMYDISGIDMSSATAAYQVEGGASDHRGPSIWDLYVRRPGTIKHNDTGDDACKSYYYWEDDIQLLKNIGVSSYRFSISWSRIFLDGTPVTKNQVGIDYYHQLIDALLSNGITPVVTMYHWDLPQRFMDAGGWLNHDTAVAFGVYCDAVFKEYGSKVKRWIPINEPLSIAQFEYCGDTHADAPGNFIPHCAWSLYLAAKNMLLGHLYAWQAYQKLDATLGGGQLGMALNGPWFFPNTPGLQKDEDASLRAFEFWWGLFANPLFVGDWSPAIATRVGQLSVNESRTMSRLSPFTPDEIAGLKGSAQFVGVNYYNAEVTTGILDELPQNRWKYNQEEYDSATHSWGKPEWRQMNASNPWILYTPFGLRALLKHIKDKYNVPVLITENGCMDNYDENLEDVTRVHYLRGHLMAISQAKHVDNVNIIGYTVWSLMDNFEWLDGYTTKFGIHQVDFTDDKRKRTPKRSATEFTNWVKDKKVPGFTTTSRF